MKQPKAVSRKNKQAAIGSMKKDDMTEERITQPKPEEDGHTSTASYLDNLLQIFHSAPPEEALKVLKEQLEGAGLIHKKNPNSRAGVRIAMEIIAVFSEKRFGEISAAPFAKLHDGLKDLDIGTVPPLLKKNSIPGVGNRPVDTTDRKRMKALISAACERLIERGDSATSAAHKISKILRKIDFRISGKKQAAHPDAKTVKYWRDQIKKDPDNLRQRNSFLESLQSAHSDLQLKQTLSSLFDLLGKPHS